MEACVIRFFLTSCTLISFSSVVSNVKNYELHNATLRSFVTQPVHVTHDERKNIASCHETIRAFCGAVSTRRRFPVHHHLERSTSLSRKLASGHDKTPFTRNARLINDNLLAGRRNLYFPGEFRERRAIRALSRPRRRINEEGSVRKISWNEDRSRKYRTLTNCS